MAAKRENFLIAISITLLFISVYLFLAKELINENIISNIVIESINTKNMATVKKAYKEGHYSNQQEKDEIITRTDLIKKPPEDSTSSLVQQLASQPAIKWQLPTKTGNVTSYPNYYHVAYDISSRNGIYEQIYPIANGVISGIYTDSAGALIITINHNIDGVNYTSQYVHLSSYAPGIYTGKYVTTNDVIGQMGRTGIATGVHLHITVVDNCALFDQNDANCKDLNSFFRYAKIRYNQGFSGLGSLIEVPNSW